MTNRDNNKSTNDKLAKIANFNEWESPTISNVYKDRIFGVFKMDEIILQNKDGKVLVSSRDVAEHFNKRHSESVKGRKNYGIMKIAFTKFSKPD